MARVMAPLTLLVMGLLVACCIVYCVGLWTHHRYFQRTHRDIAGAV